MSNVQLYLAGNSSKEKTILEKAGLKCIMEKAKADKMGRISDVYAKTKVLATSKAEKLAKVHKDGIIIAMESALSYDGKIIKTTTDPEENKRILMSLSNETISIITGVCIKFQNQNKNVMFVEETKVKFRELPKDYIDYYVTTNKTPLDKPESVVSDTLSCFIDNITGTYDNLKGVPVATIYSWISKFGYSFKDFK